ncbi:MAG: hypothetical protein AB8B97_07010 [Granulosicoccus sp.]
MQNSFIRIALLLSALLSSAVNANPPAKDLSLLDLPIGEQRETTLSIFEQQWSSPASCSIIRTGVGLTRRAYFLETCVFSNPQGHRLYKETPTSAIYHFLENQLVQVTYQFDEIVKPARFTRCAEKDAKKLKSRQNSANNTIVQGLSVTEDYQLSVSDVDMVSQIHVLRETP